jgi:hypothetical protein
MDEAMVGKCFSLALIGLSLLDGLWLRDGRVTMYFLGLWATWHVCAGVVESWQRKKGG